MGEDVERRKRRMPLLEYLRQQNWIGRPAGRWEYVGLCPLHEESRPSFYVNTRKDVFYCHGCGQGGDLIRFLQFSRHLSFREEPCLSRSSGHSRQQMQSQCSSRRLLSISSNWISIPRRSTISSNAEFTILALIRELGIGYAPGGNLRRHLTAQGYSFELLRTAGLINAQGADALYQRIVFPLRQGEHIVNLYGRSIGSAFAHRFLPGCKGGLYAWEKVRHYAEVILVEGLFDYGSLRQAGFQNATCSLGTHLNDDQFQQLCDGQRTVYLTFDVDANQSGQQAAERLAHRLGAHGIIALVASCCHRVTIPTPSSLGVGTREQFQSLLEAAQP